MPKATTSSPVSASLNTLGPALDVLDPKSHGGTSTAIPKLEYHGRCGNFNNYLPAVGAFSMSLFVDAAVTSCVVTAEHM